MQDVLLIATVRAIATTLQVLYQTRQRTVCKEYRENRYYLHTATIAATIVPSRNHKPRLQAQPRNQFAKGRRNKDLCKGPRLFTKHVIKGHEKHLYQLQR